MRVGKDPARKNCAAGTRQSRFSFKNRRRSVCSGLAFVIALAGIAQNTFTPGGALRTDKVDDPTPINQAPDANTQMQMHDQQAKQLTYSQANAERRKQITEDSAKLLKLANDLKAEVDKTTKDTLSLNVIRKADEIERLAHDVKEKMKLTVGPS